MFKKHRLFDTIKLPDITQNDTSNGRFYITPEGKRYPSITTVLGKMSDKSHLEEWRNKIGKEEADKITRQAGIRGSRFHDLAEKYLNNDTNYTKGHMPTNIFSFKQIKSILDNNVNNILAQETPLYSDYLRTAGRVDLIAEYEKELSVIDFKTSRREKKKEWIENYFMQAGFYSAAFQERTGISIPKLVIIIYCDDSEPQVFVERRKNHILKFKDLRFKLLEKENF